MSREILFRGYSTAYRKWFYGDLLHCSDGLRISNEESFVAVSEKTVGQFTGLTDKNGKKIFEGDIVSFVDYDKLVFVGVIEYWKEVAMFVVRFKHGANSFIDSRLSKIEVIGNIHDNPELLKEQDK